MKKYYFLVEKKGEQLVLKVKSENEEQAKEKLENTYKFERILERSESAEELSIVKFEPSVSNSFSDRVSYRGSRSSKRFFI